MESNKKKYLLMWGVIIIAVIAFSGWYYISQKAATSEPTDQNTATTTDTTSGATVTTPDGTQYGIVEPQPQKVNMPAPSLTRPIPDTSKLDQSMVATAKAHMQISIANLQKNPTVFQDWIDLGVERKTLGDYVGAAEDWEYVSLLYPQNTTSFGNLGDLYTNYLKDNVKAEVSYKKAIVNAPNQIDHYRNLYNLYISEKKNAEAVATLQSGINKNPNSYDLSLLLARYYRDAGNNTQAKVYYSQAISVAQKQGNTSVAESLQAEANALQ